jgi:hypothetical protein
LFDLDLDLLLRRVLGFFVVGGLQGSDAVLRVLGVGGLFFCGFLQVFGLIAVYGAV